MRIETIYRVLLFMSFVTIFVYIELFLENVSGYIIEGTCDNFGRIWCECVTSFVKIIYWTIGVAIYIRFLLEDGVEEAKYAIVPIFVIMLVVEVMVEKMNNVVLFLVSVFINSVYYVIKELCESRIERMNCTYLELLGFNMNYIRGREREEREVLIPDPYRV